MDSNLHRRRRWIGVVVLAAALLMLVAGETIFKGRLGTIGMLVYWLGCFALTAIAMILAIADASAVARRNMQARRDLVSQTIKEIEEQLKDRNTKTKD